jgi:hypothetical protein
VPQLVPHRCDSFVSVIKTNNLEVCKSSCKVFLNLSDISKNQNVLVNPPNRKFHESPSEGSFTVKSALLVKYDETGS